MTVPLSLFLPTAFPRSALNNELVQQRDLLPMSALGLRSLGPDSREPSSF